MLGRKQSIKLGDTTLIDPGGPGPGGGNDPAGMTVGALNELTHSNHTGNGWFKKTSVRHIIRICSIASLMSVCANTSRTFSWFPSLVLITFIVDIVTAVIFTIEMGVKIYSRGLFRGRQPYLRDRWCQFDATMVLFIWISIVLQVSRLYVNDVFLFSWFIAKF